MTKELLGKDNKAMTSLGKVLLSTLLGGQHCTHIAWLQSTFAVQDQHVNMVSLE